MYLKYTCNSSTLAQSNILQYIFSWTSASAQVKYIKYKISCCNLADFKYTSLVYKKKKMYGIFINHLNM